VRKLGKRRFRQPDNRLGRGRCHALGDGVTQAPTPAPVVEASKLHVDLAVVQPLKNLGPADQSDNLPVSRGAQRRGTLIHDSLDRSDQGRHSMKLTTMV
jgi:hypothetical protein